MTITINLSQNNLCRNQKRCQLENWAWKKIKFLKEAVDSILLYSNFTYQKQKKCVPGDDDTRFQHTNKLSVQIHTLTNTHTYKHTLMSFFCTLTREKKPQYIVSLVRVWCIVIRIESRLPNLKHHDKNLNAALRLELKQQQQRKIHSWNGDRTEENSWANILFFKCLCVTSFSYIFFSYPLT